MRVVDLLLNEHREVWENKPSLRVIYKDYHNRLLASIPVGGADSRNWWR